MHFPHDSLVQVDVLRRRERIPVMEVPGACLGSLLGFFHSTATPLACDHLIGLLNLDKAIGCLGTLQIRVVPAHQE